MFLNKLINNNNNSNSNSPVKNPLSINNDQAVSTTPVKSGFNTQQVSGYQPQSALNRPKPIVLSQQVSDINQYLNLSLLRDKSQNELLMALNAIFKGKPKALIVDPQVKGFLNLFTDTTFLKMQGIEKIYELKPGKFDSECKSIVYLIRPRVKYMYTISDHIKQHMIEFMKKEYAIIYIPKIDNICQRVLEELGVYGNISTFQSFPLDIVPFDNDLLSLEITNTFKDYVIDNDKSSLLSIAKSIMRLQSYFGYIPVIKGKGHCSKIVLDQLVRMRKEVTQDDNSISPSSEIDSLILIDREVDLITPLCTPLVYEGLINEYFPIKNNVTFIENNIINPNLEQNVYSSSANSLSPFPLHSGDVIFNEIRDLNIAACSVVLNRKAKSIDHKKSLTGKESLTDLKTIMRKITTGQHEEYSLKVHVGIAEKLSAITTSSYFKNRLEVEQNFLACHEIDQAERYIDECISTKDSILKILRLLSLASLTCNGIPHNDYELLKAKITQTFGIGMIITLNNMERAGFIKVNDHLEGPDSLNPYNQIREQLRLINPDVDINQPDDASYVFSGYAPLSTRFIQYSCFNPHRTSLPKPLEETLKLLPGGSYFEELQFPASTLSSLSPNPSPITLVCFVGGITYAEISSLRYLGKQLNRRFIILTTNFLNGDGFIENFVEILDHTLL
ncbi:Sec1-like family protein [Tieghemostelium lacteum]|uniref:Sec1-like family protein n=1 Tax=Tieghemostelium lacteum TaxID=361077 RepID=A0A151Z6E9_TIELA|nr:Sec1-like family protein [Tieghemostelium lacteum]|eukprot:KYQ89536.1 Sec1-like family protein [Tieghemostelium lacteum]